LAGTDTWRKGDRWSEFRDLRDDSHPLTVGHDTRAAFADGKPNRTGPRTDAAAVAGCHAFDRDYRRSIIANSHLNPSSHNGHAGIAQP
jgi:hypothetical protein